MSFLENLNWRYATKKFDTEKKVSETDKEKVLEAIKLAPTSFGIQPFHVHIVENPEILKNLRESAFGQSQITDSSFILVFSADIDIEKLVQQKIELLLDGNKEKKKEISEKWEGTKKLVLSKSNLIDWCAKQSYIALGFGLAACAEMKIDSCPMEGFDVNAFKQILNMPKNLYPQAILAVGYRLEPLTQEKKRFKKEDIFTEVK